MDTCDSESLLLALVCGIRDSCRKHAKSSDFISVSGFLNVDIDSKRQHQFVISEVIGKANKGDGQSTCLKSFDKRTLDKKCHFHGGERNETRSNCKHNVQSTMKLSCRNLNQNDRKEGTPWHHGSGRCRHKPMQKSLSGSFNHHHFSESRSKLSNQTFTVETYEPFECQNHDDHSPRVNFSSATVNISQGQNGSKMHTETGLCTNLALPDKVQTSTRLEKTNFTQELKRGQNSTIKDNIKVQTSLAVHENRVGHNNAASVEFAMRNVMKRNPQGGDRIVYGRSYQEKSRNITNPKVTKLRKISHGSSGIDKSVSYTVKSHKHEIKPMQRSKTSACSCKKSPVHILQLSKSSSSENSDESIGSTRPKYLVQHNGELLLPCPKMKVKHDSFETSALNNNRAQSLSRESSEENNVVVPSTSHISSLINSIVGALTGSSMKNQSGIANNTSALSLQIAGEKDRGAETDEKQDENSVTSNSTLNTVSSLEADLSPSPKADFSENIKDIFMIKDAKSSCRTKSCDGQLNDKFPSLSTKKSRMFKWMRIFRQDCHHLSARDYSNKRIGSFTSLRSWSSLKSIMGFTSKGGCKLKKSKARLHQK